MTKSVRRGRGKGKPAAVIKYGSARVPIYEGFCHRQIRYTVAYYMNERRHRRTFGKLDVAREEARLIAPRPFLSRVGAWQFPAVTTARHHAAR